MSQIAEMADIGLEQLRTMYRMMLRIRIAEEKLADLVEKGEIRTPCHLYIGQEAIAVGVCSALRRQDYVWGGHRSHGHYLAKGADLRALVAEIFGKVTGCSRGRGGSMHLFDKDVGVLGTVPLVAATIPLAVGTALASKLRKDGRISACFFGDGATEEGHFHESINMAALYKLAVMFVCENNFYASHMSLAERRPADNLDKIGELYGIPGFRLDGNDVIAVYRATLAAVKRALNGEGPTLLECRTYRWRGHVGPSWNLDVGVMRRDELTDWLPRDPVKRLRDTLIQLGLTHKDFDGILNEVTAEIDDAIDFARRSPYPADDDLLRYVFTTQDGL